MGKRGSFRSIWNDQRWSVLERGAICVSEGFLEKKKGEEGENTSFLKALTEMAKEILLYG